METPSKREGLPWEAEERFRFLGAQLVQMAGMLLGMPQAALLTGQTLFHQLYQKHSFLDLAVLDGAMAALFVAGKVEECYRRARDIVNVFRWLHGRLRFGKAPAPLPYICDEYYGWRDRLTTAEMLLLRALGFHVQPDCRTAVLLLISYLRALGLTERLGPRALALLNDSFRTVCPLLYPPPVLACAALDLAAESLGYSGILPSGWWTVLGAFDRVELEACVDRMESVASIKYDPDLPMIPSELAVYARVLREVATGEDRHHKHHDRHPSRSSSHARSRSRTRSRSRSRRRHRSRESRHRGHRDRHNRN